MPNRLTNVLIELKNHAPFTLLGAITGIILMVLFRNVEHQTSYKLFYIFHPLHVVLSAMVTASLFRLHEKGKKFIFVLIVGYVGAIGTATLSDSVIPYFGEEILGVAVPSEAAVHGHNLNDSSLNRHGKELHIGFIEEWYLVNPSALLGIFIAYFLPRTKFPHAMHILISTWASSAHIMMNTHQEMTAALAAGILIVLFISVWLPCCFSDIVFPMLFVGKEQKHTCCGG
jgi:hypothetical protein